MDPNACLREINRILVERDEACYDTIDDMVSDLRDWLNNGGFQPDWQSYQLGTSYYKTMATKAAKR